LKLNHRGHCEPKSITSKLEPLFPFLPLDPAALRNRTQQILQVRLRNLWPFYQF
jgi:hypothetical protein